MGHFCCVPGDHFLDPLSSSEHEAPWRMISMKLKKEGVIDLKKTMMLRPHLGHSYNEKHRKRLEYSVGTFTS